MLVDCRVVNSVWISTAAFTRVSAKRLELSPDAEPVTLVAGCDRQIAFQWGQGSRAT